MGVSGHGRSWNEYFYPGTDVLVNLLGIRDSAALAMAEGELISARQVQMDTSDYPAIAETFDREHLRGLHRWLAQDVYPWAGEYRHIGVRKGVSDFAAVEDIDRCVSHAAAIAADTDWADIVDEGFAEQSAKVFGWLNYAHPFRDVNGRATRAFMDALAAKSGRFLYYGAVPRAVWVQRCAMSMPDLDRENPYHEYLTPVFAAMARELAEDPDSYAERRQWRDDDLSR